MVTGSLRPHHAVLQAVNVTQLPCAGSTSLTVHLSPECILKWNFLVADIAESIVGMDFLAHHKLSPNVVRRSVFRHPTNRPFSCDSSSSGSSIVDSNIVRECIKTTGAFETLLSKWCSEHEQVLHLRRERENVVRRLIDAETQLSSTKYHISSLRVSSNVNKSKVYADMSAESKTSALETIRNGNQKFTVDVYKILSECDGNLFFSPTSVQVILALVHLGAKGNTAEEIAGGLHLPSDKAIIEEGFSALMDQLQGSGDTILEIANKIYAQASFPIKEEFKASAAKFLAEAQEVNFVEEAEKSRTIINEWVEKKTNQKIQNLIPQGVLDAMTRLVLVNAVYFKGKWSMQFKKEATSPMPFHISATEEKTVDMMHIKKKFMYTEAQELDSQVLELPYKGDQLSMVILLPKKIDGLKDLEGKLINVNLSDILNKMRKVDVNVYLPKFKLEYRVDLSNTLKKLGMMTMFDEGKADFTGISDSKPGLVVSKVFHKAFIEVNEEGTEAAAATGITIMALSLPPPPVDFRVNHPFLFFLKDASSNIIFFGHVITP